MTQGVLLEYDRSGGRRPSDDERFEVRADGRFEARRTVGGSRIGTFAGALDPATLGDLEREVARAGEAGDLHVPTPMDGATETFRIAGAEASMGSNQQPEGAWGVLTQRVRRLLDAVVPGSPAAAVELAVAPDAGRLVHVGSAAIELDLASVVTRLVRLDEQGLVLARWQGATVEGQVEDAGAAAEPGWTAVGPGWSAPIPFDHPLELAPGDRLQVWVTLGVRQGERTRAGRLFRVVRPGSS